MFKFKRKKDDSIIETTNEEDLKQLSFFKKLVKLTTEPESPYILKTEKKLKRKLMLKNKKAKTYREPMLFEDNNENSNVKFNNEAEIIKLLNKFNEINQKVNNYKTNEEKRLQKDPNIFKIKWED